MTTGIPKHLECLREAEDRGCQLGGGGNCGTLWGTWCTGRGTHTHAHTVILRSPRSTGPFLEISALNCKITLFQVFSVKTQRAGAQQTLPEGH